MTHNIYAIGDIHGCLGHLERLLETVNPDLTKDKLLFIGDYIDRGPDSSGVVDFILGLQARYPADNIICLRGNHEVMLLDFLAGQERELFLANGGRSTLREYFGDNWDSLGELRLPPEHEIFYRELKSYYETPEFIFVHGGLRPGLALSDQVDADLFWIRGEFIMSTHDFGRRVIFGHTPMRRPLLMPNKIGIDTGAVYGNFLTCLKLPEVDFFITGHQFSEAK